MDLIVSRSHHPNPTMTSADAADSVCCLHWRSGDFPTAALDWWNWGR